MYSGICTSYPHPFPAAWCSISCLTISHMAHQAQMNGYTWRSISSSPKRSCQSLANTQLGVCTTPPLLAQLPQPGWTRNRLFALEGTQFPTALLHPAQHGRTVEFQPWNGFKTQRKWFPGGGRDEMIHIAVLLAGGGSTSVFLQEKVQDLSLPARAAVTYSTCQPPAPDPLLSPPAGR